MNKLILMFFLLILLVGCNKKEYQNPYVKITENENYDFWHLKDYDTDSIPGLSLNKAYNTFLKSKKGNDVIVAIIDTDINITHEDLKNNIWINDKEIPNNGIDDDKNGYKDDINGWNFLRAKSGKRILYHNYSHIDVIRKYDTLFKSKTIKEVGIDSVNFKLYKRALKYYEITLKRIKSDYEEAYFLINALPKGIKVMDSLFNKSNYTFQEVDSVYYVYEKLNPVIAESAAFMYDYIKYNMVNWGEDLLEDTKNIDKIVNNIKANPRSIIGEDFGSPIINGDLEKLTHGTTVMGVIASNRINNRGVIGITNNVKIMTLSIQPRIGDASDKDLALAIKYAVNNGAKIINYSALLDFSLNSELVQDALKYAEQKDVLFVRAAGNSGQFLDSIHKHPYNKYHLSNFIIVTAINKNINSNFKPGWVNYGKNTVDLLAPGIDIPTTKSNGEYHIASGTSMAAPMVVGVAALIKAYYPTLTMIEIKKIILETVSTYDIDIVVKRKPKKSIHFSNLTKSGGVLNAYNAIKLAEEKTKKY